MTLSERTLLAQELHDGIAQDLVGVAYSLDLILGNPLMQGEVRIELRNARFQVSELTQKVRREIHDLYRQNGDDLEEQITRAVRSNFPDLNLHIAWHAGMLNLSGEKCFQVLRIIGELLNNICAHAPTSQASISIDQSGGDVVIEVKDDGDGGLELKEGHYGLKIATQRSHFIGGTLSFSSSSEGTSALLTFPLI
jgi:two-component system, NarL family, sensor histidine kinase LiaS